MNVLLVYPQYPDTYWSFRNALRFISKRAAFPPLGLITIAALLPSSWSKRLVDMNVSALSLADLQWADYVFISAMSIQRKSAKELIELCVQHGKTVVAGGPLFTQDAADFSQVNHFVLNEGEITLPLFLSDIANGNRVQSIYSTSCFADITKSPVPDYHLLVRKHYASMSLQITRGCPFACDFCEITSLLGHRVRMKSIDQVVKELEMLYRLNWRGSVFIVDDNFIGNKRIVRDELLPEMRSWMQNHGYPFSFHTQASINLADDDELLEMMVDSGFSSVFIGIETPADESLAACNKKQNQDRDLISSVKHIQKSGLEVSGGFIVGFDSDTSSIFQRQVDFIQKSGIVSAMVGLLNAPKNTALYNRLLGEHRLISEQTGNNTDLDVNFIPKMNLAELIGGYKSMISSIYSAKPYYKRVREFMRSYQRRSKCKRRFEFNNLQTLAKSIYILGVKNVERFEFWKLLFWTLANRPKLLLDALAFAVYGYHYRSVYGLMGRRQA